MTARPVMIDHAIHDTDIWLKDLTERVGGDDRQYALGLLRAVLHALRDRVGPTNAIHFGAQLPTVIRGIYYEGWKGEEPQTKERHIDEFLEHVRAEANQPLHGNAEHDVRAVFTMLCDRMDDGEIAKLVHRLPKDLRRLWPPIVEVL